MKRPLRIGLTGGMGSGKSTALALFRALGTPTFDADDVVRDLTSPGGVALSSIRAAFGEAVFSPDGTLNRAALRQHIFAHDSARKRLEAILHPLVYAELDTRTARESAPYLVLGVPLLLETGRRHWVDRVLVMDLPEDVQYQRICARDGLDDALIAQIRAAQWPRRLRLSQADDVLDNSGTLESLTRAVNQLDAEYRTRATQGCL